MYEEIEILVKVIEIILLIFIKSNTICVHHACLIINVNIDHLFTHNK